MKCSPTSGTRSVIAAMLSRSRSLFCRCALLTLALVGAAAAPSAAAEPPYAEVLRHKLLEELTAEQVPGALVYVNDPNLGIWKASLGSADLSGTPIDINSHMRIGSVTKTIAAVAVLLAVDNGLIALDAPIARYLHHTVPGGGHITVRQLLNHTAGLFNNTEDDNLNVALDANPFQIFTPLQSLAIAFAHKPYFKFGKEACNDITKAPCWHYSNTNYIVLGMLLEEVTGRAVADIFRDWIFSPLGMTETSLPDIQDNAIPQPHPRGYLFGTNVQSNNAYKAAISGDVEGSKINVPRGAPPNDATDWNPAYTWTSGSVISTLSDMAVWAKALATGVLLKPQTYAEQLHWAPRSTYGLGISEVMPGFVGHNGAIPGFQTVVSYSRDDGATIIVLTNSEVVPNRPLGAALPAENLAEMIRQTLFPIGDSQQRK